MKKLAIIVFMLFGFIDGIFSQQQQWKPTEFIITFWNPIIMAYVDQIKRDGFNLFTSHPFSNLAEDTAKLNAAYKSGMKVVFSTKDSVKHRIETREENYWETITNHSAYSGFFLKDEPGLDSLEYWKETYELYKDIDKNPNNFAWINLFPVYATNEQLGCDLSMVPLDCYKFYINEYTNDINFDFLSYDFYRFDNGNSRDKDYFINLELLRTKAKEKQKPLIFFLQGTQYDADWKKPSYTELSWQAYTSMTYGSKGIAWFVYGMEDDTLGCYNVNPSTNEIIRMPIADSVAKINQYIRTLGPELIELESTHVYHTGAYQESTTPIPVNCPINVKGGNFVVGMFKDGDDSENYFMITNKDYTNSDTATVQLNIGKNLLKKFQITVEDNPYPDSTDWDVSSSWDNVPIQNDGSYLEILSPGSGTLFKVCLDTIIQDTALLCGQYSEYFDNSSDPFIGKTVLSCSETTIDAGAKVVVVAADEILINDDFEVLLGGQFYAYNQPILSNIPSCGETLLKNVSEKFNPLVRKNIFNDSIDVHDDNSLIFYPNPCKGNLYIKSNLAERSNINIQVYNFTGLLIKSKYLYDVQKETINFDLSDVKKGIYLIYIRTNNFFNVKKLIVE